MKITMLLVQTLFFAVGLGFLTSCYPQDQPKIAFGPDKKSDLVVIFKKDVTYKEIAEFDYNVIGTPDGRGGGTSLPGMFSVSLIVKGEYKGKSIDFKPNATEEQKAYVRSRVRGANIVLRVYEQVAPDEIDDILE